MLIDLGQPELARSAVESGRLLLESLDFPAEQSRLLVAESMVWFRQGQSRQASEAAAQAERLASVAGERNLVGWARRVRSQAEQAMGQPDDAIALARSSAALFESIGAPEQRLRSNRVLAFALWRAGRFAEAVTLQRHNLAEAREQDSVFMLAGGANDLAIALLEWGQVEQARPFADLARQVTQGIDHVPTQGWGQLCAAELALADGVPHEAMTHATNALSMLEHGSPMGLAQAHRVAALACIAQSKDTEAESHWTASLSFARRYGQVLEEERTRRASAVAGR